MKQIPLTRNKATLVDDEDYDFLMKWKWCCTDTGYAIRRENDGTGVRMHRLIAKTPKGMFTDHINGNKLDNRKSNLRTCNKAQNGMNRDIRADNTTGYKGAYWDKSGRGWYSRIKAEGVNKFFGYFKTKEEAAFAYNKAAIKYYGEFAWLNKI